MLAKVFHVFFKKKKTRFDHNPTRIVTFSKHSNKEIFFHLQEKFCFDEKIANRSSWYLLLHYIRANFQHSLAEFYPKIRDCQSIPFLQNPDVRAIGSLPVVTSNSPSNPKTYTNICTIVLPAPSSHYLDMEPKLDKHLTSNIRPLDQE